MLFKMYYVVNIIIINKNQLSFYTGVIYSYLVLNFYDYVKNDISDIFKERNIINESFIFINVEIKLKIYLFFLFR